MGSVVTVGASFLRLLILFVGAGFVSDWRLYSALRANMSLEIETSRVQVGRRRPRRCLSYRRRGRRHGRLLVCGHCHHIVLWS